MLLQIINDACRLRKHSRAVRHLASYFDCNIQNINIKKLFRIKPKPFHFKRCICNEILGSV